NRQADAPIYKISVPQSVPSERHQRQYRESGFVLVRNSAVQQNSANVRCRSMQTFRRNSSD
ncbi:hypothetical protein, partial [Ruegeria profundi]|uniref:hypothetical protein n=1 Tax=Ruegeria profundi TaxID=1685378 RepID=UPI001969A832